MEGCQGPGELVLEPVTFHDLPDWERDDLKGFALAMRRSCIAKGVSHANVIADIEVGDWQPFCQALAQDPDHARVAIETMLVPYRVLSRVRGEQGLFTGYYEPIVQASRIQHGPYQHPIYKKPDDLIVEEDLDQGQGRRRVRRYDPSTGQYQPYLTRADIVAGALLGKGFELAWAHDAVDLFFMQIQGSGVL
jgi:membrane-bound lytic murein transglycosylase A